MKFVVNSWNFWTCLVTNLSFALKFFYGKFWPNKNDTGSKACYPKCSTNILINVDILTPYISKSSAAVDPPPKNSSIIVADVICYNNYNI